MAASAAAAPKASARGSKGPRVNAFDLPELMPGASPSANPAQKEEFQQRCRQLHRDEEEDQREHAETATVMRAAAGSGATSADLEAMFPMLDASLVRSLLAEAPNTQHAIDTLLALSADISEPVAGGQARPPSPPPRNVGVEDHNKFPSLMDSGGWQVVNVKQLEQDNQELGSGWRDRAKAAADIPAPRPAPSAAPQALAGRRKQTREKGEEQLEQQEFQTDYEFRQSAGQRRAQHKVKYGRGGAAAAQGLKAPKSSEDDSSEEEEPEESGGLAD